MKRVFTLFFLSIVFCSCHSFNTVFERESGCDTVYTKNILKKVSQQSLNSFSDKVTKNPDYTLEQAVKDFPEIKDNEDLFDAYTVYHNTKKAKKYSDEVLNAKFTLKFGYEIVDISDLATPGPGGVSNVASGPKRVFYTNTSANKYFEVTFKRGEGNEFRKVKPGETISITIDCSENPPKVVGEREISENE
jgi:hypothetical protein